jgi:hypothetical protein
VIKFNDINKMAVRVGFGLKGPIENTQGPKPADAGLPHVNAEVKKSAVDAWLAPEGVLATHPAD